MQNNKKIFGEYIKKIRVSKKNETWLTYDRFAPESFSVALHDYVKEIKRDTTMLVDISAMSKFLIVVLLQELRILPNDLEIVYAEAKLYHPTEKTFLEKTKGKGQQELPIFLTTDIYKIVTTYSLSCISMQGYPIVLLSFLTFNYRELAAIINEITPELSILFEGNPHKKNNEWRLKAVRWINKKVTDYIRAKKLMCSTFYYKELLKYLESIYQKYGDTHKLVVAPTGSKLQTIAVFLFKQLHPDVQFIYPVTRKFSKEYTSGVERIWTISFPEFNRIINQLDKHRKGSLLKLKEKIDLLERKHERIKGSADTFFPKNKCELIK